jgi:hypothetical protein
MVQNGTHADTRLPPSSGKSGATANSHVDVVVRQAEALCAKFGDKLPPAKAIELYLIEGIADVTLPAQAAAKGQAQAVIYPPEFLFVVDVGLEALVGGNVFWQPTYLGDPDFPENRDIHLRSVRGRDPANLIFPKIAGSLMIGVQDGTPSDAVENELKKHGLQDIKINGTFVTANCSPFREAAICAKLEREIGFIKYAEANGVVRIVDFSPGWFAKRLI